MSLQRNRLQRLKKLHKKWQHLIALPFSIVSVLNLENEIGSPPSLKFHPPKFLSYISLSPDL